MIHHMNLNPEPFHLIENGIKTIELRLYDEKRQSLHVGDTIVFTDTDDGSIIYTKIKDLYCFDSFRELYQQLPLLKCGYTEDDISTAKPEDMEAYYPPELQKKYGVLGIELEVLR